MTVLKWFTTYVWQHMKLIIIFFVFVGIFAAVFSVYRLEVEAVFYAGLLCAIVGMIVLMIDFAQFYSRHKRLCALRDKIAVVVHELPAPKGIIESDYTVLIKTLNELRQENISTANGLSQDMLDICTLWVHQIKTPIAAMGMLIQSDETLQTPKLSQELFRIEQYVEMLLTYIRLGSHSTDYVLQTYSLETIVRSVVRKLAPVFIYKKLTLDLQAINVNVLTDEKWLSFVIEQVLSNALKYTSTGTIKIFFIENALLIEDTGIGIAAEDLPRIGEKGFTGYNGRTDKKATGLGLYLCKSICQKLNHGFHAESQVGKGTRVYLTFL
ncbi:MAG: sensor histidine kinase [Defluviitaleaceae bacterium]|nr:sensor histidine kinase [Defluviitaleaceae bacterium]